MDPTYVDFDDLEETPRQGKRAVWQTPEENSLQATMLSACDRTYYHTKKEKDLFDNVAENSLPLAAGKSAYPLEYVEEMIAWAEGKNANRPCIDPIRLASAIKNKDNRTRFYNRLEHKNWRNSR